MPSWELLVRVFAIGGLVGSELEAKNRGNPARALSAIPSRQVTLNVNHHGACMKRVYANLTLDMPLIANAMVRT